MLCHVALVRTDVSEEPSASFIMVTRIGELGTTLAVTSLWVCSQEIWPLDHRGGLGRETPTFLVPLEKGNLKGPNRVDAPLSHLKTETDPVSESLCSLFLEYRKVGKAHKTQ
jgi:hypothetical protein